MAETIFFSWQADTQTLTGRNLIERALERAIGRVNDQLEIDEPDREEIVVDRDTKGVGGQPPIVDTIFKKIDETAVFVPDLTFVSARSDGRPTPNPNVLIEYGWALKSLGHGRIVPIMNIAYGKPTGESMPFDMRHLRNPITFDLPENASESQRKAEREALADVLEQALRDVFKSEGFRDQAKLIEKPTFVPFPAADRPSRFRHPGIALGINDSLRFQQKPREIFLADGAGVWLRLSPVFASGQEWSAVDLQAAGAQNRFLLAPLFQSYGDLGFLRAEDGFGVFASMGDDPTPAVTFAFERGEIWSVDSYFIPAVKSVGNDMQPGLPMPLVEMNFKNAISRFRELLSDLGISPPYKWIAGVEGMAGVGLYMSPAYTAGFSRPQGTCVADIIMEEGLLEIDQTPADALRPFFSKIFSKCGITRPINLDEIGNRA